MTEILTDDERGLIATYIGTDPETVEAVEHLLALKLTDAGRKDGLNATGARTLRVCWSEDSIQGAHDLLAAFGETDEADARLDGHSGSVAEACLVAAAALRACGAGAVSA